VVDGEGLKAIHAAAAVGRVAVVEILLPARSRLHRNPKPYTLIPKP